MCIATALYHFMRPSHPPKQPRRPIILFTLLLALILLATLLLYTLPIPFPLPNSYVPCKNALVFTAPHHKSIWLIDSIDHCTHSPNSMHANDVFEKTQLWSHALSDAMRADDALRYIATNSSVSIFPNVFNLRRADVTHLLSQQHNYSLTVLVLHRNPESVWDDTRRQIAWQTQSAPHSAPYFRNQTAYDLLIGQVNTYYDAVEQLLTGMQVVYDVLHYDEVKQLPVISATNNACSIRNCNFRHEHMPKSH